MNSPFKLAEGFEAPHGSNIIWRYMSLEKFLDLLERQVLRFTQASKLTDNRELRLPYEKIESSYWKKLRGLKGDDARLNYYRTMFEELEAAKKRVSDLRESTYLSSWSIAQDESYALWKIYLGGSRAGVAVKSTFSALQKSIAAESGKKITCARIRYTDDVNPKNLRDEHFIYQKSTHYEYEKELRLAMNYQPDLENRDPLHRRMRPNGDPAPNGFNVNVSIDMLIREIYLSPFAMRGFRETFEQIVKKVRPELQAKVKISAVRDS